MATVLGRVPLDKLSTDARRVRFGRALQTAIAAALWVIGFGAFKVARSVLFAVGWVAYKAWTAVVWCALAVKLGWVEAQAGGRRGPA